MKKVLKTQGFNLGQMHHFAQLEWKNNGYIPDVLIADIKEAVDPALLETCRMSGTMSNSWALDIPGYNHMQHNNQINGRRDVSQPTISYFYPFVDFYKKMGFKDLVWTLNTISPWSNPSERGVWERRMWDMLDALDKEGIKISTICMENEMWMYPQCVVMPNGNLNLGHKLLSSPKDVLKNNTWWGNNIIKPGMRAFLKYLETISFQIKRRYPNVKIAVSTDNNTHFRGRLLTEVLREFDFYDIICPHIYITSETKVDTLRQVKQRIDHAKTFGKEVWVTEWNWAYGGNDQGVNWGRYHDNFFREDMLAAFQLNKVDAAFFHTLWSGRSSYGYVPQDY